MANIDEVHDLLNAVNTVTLKRMEDKTDAINAVTLKRMEEKTNMDLKRIEEKADRATAATNGFQSHASVQLDAALVKLGDIETKLQMISTALFGPSTPPPTPGPPTVDER